MFFSFPRVEGLANQFLRRFDLGKVVYPKFKIATTPMSNVGDVAGEGRGSH